MKDRTRQMDAESINFLAAPAAFLLGLAASPIALRKAGFGWAKVAFGTLAVAFSGLAIAGIVQSIQHKAGATGLPLAWVVPALVVAVVFRLSRVQARD